MNKRIHVKMIVHGRVQGVGFRYTTQMIAQQLGITGWVRNAYDGTVHIEAEGEEPLMKQFVAKIKEGPRFSEVTHVEEVYLDESGGFHFFDIRF